MPELRVPKRERFAQLIAAGKMSIVAAYIEAGYAGHLTQHSTRTSADRLKRSPEVTARVRELREIALGGEIEDVVASIHDICRQLDEDRKFAIKCKKPGDALAASMGKAKVLGYLSDRLELTGRNGGAIEVRDMSLEEAARRVAFMLAAADRKPLAPSILIEGSSEIVEEDEVVYEETAFIDMNVNSDEEMGLLAD